LTSNAPCVTAATVPSNLMSIFADYLTVKNTGNALTGLQLYPNPNEGSFTVTGTVTGNEEITYNVTDVTGRVLMTGTLQPENGMLKAVIKMDGSITAGQYQIRFTAEGINQVMQFVKMN
jgi:hypothetical protein